MPPLTTKDSIGPTGDDHEDIQNDGATSEVCAEGGTLPVWEHTGPPIESKANEVGPLSEHLSS